MMLMLMLMELVEVRCALVASPLLCALYLFNFSSLSVSVCVCGCVQSFLFPSVQFDLDVYVVVWS